jgi:hypothetical protein
MVVIDATVAEGAQVPSAVRAALPGWELEPREVAARLPCGRDERCVLVADGSVDAAIPDDDDDKDKDDDDR